MTKDSKTLERMADEFSSVFGAERRKTIAKKSWWTGYKAAQQWTSVYDALPETDEDLLWCNPHSGIVIVAPYNHKFSGELGEQYFTHWMVVPAMPKDAKE